MTQVTESMLTESLLTESMEAGPLAQGGSPPAMLVGERLVNRFRIVRGLGQGGMAQIYEAFDEQLDRRVAVKVIRPDLASRPGVVERFKAEVRLAHRVTHPNVCRIFDLFQELPRAGGASPLFFLTMELIPGSTLADRLRDQGPMASTLARDVLRQVAEGLSAAHRAGVVHGDLKPSNLMFRDAPGPERVVIVDFGLAFLLRRQGAANPGSARRGTLAYMAPECAAGAPPSPASDLYSFGLVALEVLAGRRVDLPAASVVRDRRLRRFIADPTLRAQVHHCLRRDPAERPDSAEQVAQALAAWRPEVHRQLPDRPHWRIEEKLGEGGFGDVWLIRHGKTGELRVLKFCDDRERRAALQREVTLFRLMRQELGARDDINRVLDWNLSSEPFYLETEYSAGGDLETWARRQGGLTSIPRDQRLELVAQAAEALAAAHSIGVLHKDVKPANILIDPHPEGPRVKVADFGIGHALDQDRLRAAGITILGLTASSAAATSVGSRLYAAPEVLEGRQPTVQADIFALGVLLYQAWVGDFSRAMAPGWRRQVSDPLVCDDIAAAVDGQPKERPSAAGLARRLRRLEQRRTERAAHSALEARAARSELELARAARRRRFLLSGLGVALTVVLALAWTTQRIAREAAKARDATRLAVAIEKIGGDPTEAALALLESTVQGDRARALMRQTLAYPLARLQLESPKPYGHVEFLPGSETLVTSEGGRLYLRPTGLGGGRAGPRERIGETARMTDFEVDPSGRFVVAVSLPNRIEVHDLELGTTRTVDGPMGRVWRVDVDPTGRWAAVPSEDGAIYVFPVHAADGGVISLWGHRHWVIDVRFSADSERLASASRDGTVRIWRRRDGALLHELEGHGSWVFWVEWSADDRFVVSASRDGTARVWDLEGEQPARILSGHSLTVDRAYFHPDGESVLTMSQDGTLRRWPLDGSAHTVLETSVGGADIALSPDRRLLLTSSAAGFTRLPAASGAPARLEFPAHRRASSLAISPDGRWVAGAMVESLRIWPLEPETWGRVLYQGSAAIKHVLPDPRGNAVLIASADPKVRAVDFEGKRVSTVRSHGGAVNYLAIQPGGRRLAAASRDDTVSIGPLGSWSSEPVSRLPHDGSVYGLAFHPGGSLLAVRSFRGRLGLWTLGSDGPRLFLGGRALAEAWGRDVHVVSISFDLRGRLWLRTSAGDMARFEVDLTNAALKLEGEPWPASFTCFSLSRDGRRLAGTLGTSEVAVFDLTRDDAWPPPRLWGADFESRSLGCPVWSADGGRLAVPFDSAVRLFEPNGDGPPITVLGHGDAVTTVALLDDGRLLSGSLDGSVRLWRTDLRDAPAELQRRVEICLAPEDRRLLLLETEAEAERGHRACVRRG